MEETKEWLIDAPDSQENEKIDVIIPVYKPDGKFRQLIERLVKQSRKPNTIFLLHTLEEPADSAAAISSREAIDFVKSLKTEDCNIHYTAVKKADFDHGGTRNLGASLSNAAFVVFMTQDAVPADSHLIENLIVPFKEKAVAAAYARQLPNPKSGIIESYTREFNYPLESYLKSEKDLPILGIKTYFCSNVCAVYRKKVYEELGGFVLKTIFNEDMIMAAGIIRAGYSIAYQADARVYHSHVYNYRQQFKRNFDLAVSQEQYREIFKAVKSENEGIKLVKRTLNYLCKEGKYYLIPDLILQSAFKYFGYKAGRNFKKLPLEFIKKLSMNPGYWEDDIK
ncbi:rhamnosyltransferase [Anaerocolumna cellulosilytica]|uniref:Rhamnosyltransferase n=1 Tax=Anaerocolumna cellulosilytica TaxID=433286 RepID=A0A6S6QYM5_9FIRM|nr:glycosyltransferase family 2 protein [Anaerocolumna cellulosilytica]MBB5196634.1 rhamnosyltransferase [Anaerocolumna cellulosilytica]BCJ95734.1 rhamnosyltransferase [Anaerocolumna cellulosilytica]